MKNKLLKILRIIWKVIRTAIRIIISELKGDK